MMQFITQTPYPTSNPKQISIEQLNKLHPKQLLLTTTPSATSIPPIRPLPPTPPSATHQLQPQRQLFSLSHIYFSLKFKSPF